MAKGYWIASVDVHDDDAYAAYREANAAPFARFGAHFLVRGGQHEVVEGSARSRNVVLEFPSYEAALECYNSAEYQAAKAIRDPVSDGDVIIIEGYN